MCRLYGFPRTRINKVTNISVKVGDAIELVSRS